MRAIIGITFAVLLAGCGGMPPQARTMPATPSAPGAPVGPGAPRTGTAAVRFTITPTKAQSAHTRQAQYISVATQSAGITVTRAGSPTTTAVINCTNGSCSGSVDAPIGTDTFTVNLFDQPGGHGTILSAGSATQTIVQNAANNVFLTFNGVADHVNYVVLDNPNPRIGATASSKVTVAVSDPDGYTIVGPGSYDLPVVLTLADSSGSTSLSSVTLHSPAEFSTLSYNGTAKIVATVSAAIQGRSSAAQLATFEPINLTHEYSIPNASSAPMALVEGPDNAIWFAENSGNKVGRIDTTGFITQYATTGSPRSLIVGPDGALWFTEVASSAGKVYGRVTTAGVVTEYALNPATAISAGDLVFGPTGTLYLSEYSSNNGSIYAVTPTTGAVLKNYPGNAYPSKMAFGSDGNLYASESHDIMRVRISDDTTQIFTQPNSYSPYSLVLGQDGKIWFTELSGNKIGNLTTAGTITEYPLPNISNDAWQIISAADGTFWFTMGTIQDQTGSACRIGHSTQTGTITSWAIADCHTMGLAFGADGNIWLAEKSVNKIGVFPLP